MPYGFSAAQKLGKFVNRPFIRDTLGGFKGMRWLPRDQDAHWATDREYRSALAADLRTAQHRLSVHGPDEPYLDCITIGVGHSVCHLPHQVRASRKQRMIDSDTMTPQRLTVGVCFTILALLCAQVAWSEPPDRQCSSTKWGQSHCIRDAHFVYDTCNAIAVFSERHGLNADFFARLIWQESRFDPNALSHANARGIAQFIPSTAALRGLLDPYNAADALEHSAQYLAEMSRRYGNEGLAAIGYNGGERRVEGFLRGGGLADETIAYVPIITGLDAETWRDAPPEKPDFRLSKTADFLPACYAMGKARRLTPLKLPEPPLKPWGVQIAFGKSKAQAQAAYARRVAKCPAPLSGERPDYLKVEHRVSRQKGFIMARVGRNSRAAADKLCTSVRAAGCPCAVYANN